MLRLRPRVLLALAGLAMMVLAVWQVHRLALQNALVAAEARAETTLRMASNALEGDLARYEVMPQLLAELEPIRDLFAHPDDPARRGAINQLLLDRNTELQSSDIYVMLTNGETIAASNYLLKDSFVGQNFAYRPYFIRAAEGGHGRFYGVGTTSGVRGYFFSAPIYLPASDQVAGVIAVKIGLDRTEAGWRGGEQEIFVTDPEHIVFLSSDPALLYGSLTPLTPERLARTEASRRYSDQPLHEISLQNADQAGVPLVTLSGGREMIAVEQEVADVGWTVHVLLDTAPARTEAQSKAIAAFLLLCLAGFGLAVLLQRRARSAERMMLEAQAKADLERRVEERTAELKREVAERRATEAELRAAQANLLRVGKLAALGQMSATLSHEINQPLAAARNYADSAAILIERGDTTRARENLGHILTLIDRMAAIGRHLRNAARKPKDRLEPVVLAQLLAETQIILAGNLARAGATLELELPPDLPPLRAGATRMQQVLVNLISNAVDAVEHQSDRRITLRAEHAEGRIKLFLRDRGAGISPAIAERIFDPFFTTKGVGAGLGLGLSICYNIIRDFGGEISALPANPGTEFVVTLGAWSAHEAAA